MDDFDRVADEGVGCFAISLILRLVLGPDIAAFGLESTVAVDADERARASDFGGIVDDGPIFEIVEFGLDLAKPPVDLLGKLLVGIRIAFFNLRHFVAQGRSEERRVGKECVSTCRSRWSSYR